MYTLREFDKNSLDRFDHWFDQEAFYAGDYEGMASIYTEDAKLMNEDSEIIVGRPAIREFWKIATERAKSVSMKRTKRTEELESSGRLGFKRTTLTLEIPIQDRIITHFIKSITIWKQGDDGIWRVYVDISNRNAPLDIGQFAYGIDSRKPT